MICPKCNLEMEYFCSNQWNCNKCLGIIIYYPKGPLKNCEIETYNEKLQYIKIL